MRREPLFISLARLLLSGTVVAIVAMIYWSSILIEEKMDRLDAKMSLAIEQLHERKYPVAPQVTHVKSERLIDDALPNLLDPDPFYSEVLPKLLPPGFQPHGTFRSAALSRPHTLHPFSGWQHISDWTEMCVPFLGQRHFCKHETLAPSLAIKMEERKDSSGRPEFWVHLRDHVYWAPLEQRFFSDDVLLADHFFKRHQVTAEDFKLHFDAVMNPYNQEQSALAQRTYFEGVEEFRVIDPLTFVVRWKVHEVVKADGTVAERIKYSAKLLTGQLRPLASFVYKYFADGSRIIEDDDYRSSSLWAQNFVEHWAKNIIPSCGSWLFDGMSDREVRFRRNPDFYEPLAALGTNWVYTFRNSFEAAWQDFKAGNIDSHILDGVQLAEYEDFIDSQRYRTQAGKGNEVSRLDYLARAFYYIGWNHATPYFNSRKVRLAMTMAIDRQRIIEDNLNGMAVEITGPFYPDNHHIYDHTIAPWPFDPKQARQLLEEEGWYDSDGDGIVEKEIDGQRVPFIFDLTYYVKVSSVKAICEYIATALKDVGVLCRLNGVDIADLSSSFQSKSFDALVIGWGKSVSPPDPRQIWHSAGAQEPGSSNSIGFANAEVDAIIEALDYEYDRLQRQQLYYRFDAILHEEQPYTFLYVPKRAFIYRNWLKNVFVPAHMQHLIPGADVEEPEQRGFWLEKR